MDRTSIHSSKLVQDDQLTIDTYKSTGFNVSSTTTVPLSYTSTRVMKPVYNTYEKNEMRVIGYMTDQCQYDSRLDGDMEPSHSGHGYDITQIDVQAYDKIVLASVGILGDEYEKSEQINKAAKEFGITVKWSPVLVDPFADVLSHRNVGFSGQVSNDARDHFDQKKAQGILGGLRLMKDKNPNLSLSLSVGGWYMSQAFHDMVQSDLNRVSFINGLIELYQRFPMLNEIDLNWMYPGLKEHDKDTIEQTNDPKHYVMLITELRSKLNSIKRDDIRINIALPGCVELLKKLPIQEFLNSGVHGISLVTTDFYRSGVSENLVHHTNIQEYRHSQMNIIKPVEYLLSINVPAKMIYIGYSGQSRNAIGVNIKKVSDLEVDLDRTKSGNAKPTGSFHTGVTEYQDILLNYMDFETQTGRNGFQLYTDTDANADFLYNQNSKLFISIDTPRTVRAKAELVKSKGLGGLWTWAIENDRGLLVNAAREGFACKVTHSNIDMSKFYFQGKASI